jgi:Nucleotidyl transferase AbiEii toxin, Type IV TA system
MNDSGVNIKLKDILTELFNLDKIKDFYLAGGTNLALKYNHRVSTDLDLFYNNSVEINLELHILPVAENYFKDRLKIISVNRDTLRTTIDDVKVDFMKWLNIKNILKPVQKFDNTNWQLATDMDVAAMKISAVINRGSKKDFFDMALLLKLFTLTEIIEGYKMKYQIQSDNDIVKYLTDFHEADLESNTVIQVIDFEIKNWEEIKTFIKDNLNNYIKKDINFNT